MTRKTIMIVDDNQEFLEELKELLDLSGYDAVSFKDGDTAIDNLAEVHPDAVLLDLKMSGRSGFQIANEINQNPASSHIPIVAMTGYFKEKEHESLMKQCGIKTCLMKPFNPLDVIAEIEHVCKGGKGRLETTSTKKRGV